MCSICEHDPCHPSCPNYNPENNSGKKKPLEYCSVCGVPILPGEQYIENSRGEKIHMDCYWNTSIHYFFNWVGIEIKTMDGD